MVVGDITTGADLVVIGAGPGGYTAAIRAAQKGLDVVLVEKERVGGICLNHGCIPAKSLIHAAGFQKDIEHWEEIGIHTENLEVDFQEIQEWKDEVIEKLDNGILNILDHHGVEYMKGTARFLDSNTIRVEEEHNAENVEFDKAIIATGSQPVEIPGLEFDKDKVISSREILQLEEVPDEIVVVGGGYIGMEAVTKFCKFGATVKVVEARDRVLKMFEEEIVNSIQETNESYRDEIYTSATAKKVEYEDDKAILVADQDGEELRISGDHILVAAGRNSKPVLEKLSLQNTDAEINEDGFLPTDEQMQTKDKNIFCIGDAAGQPMLAHKAYREGKVAAEAAAGEPAAFDNEYIPEVMYTDPEVAVVGLNETEARKKHDEIKVGKFPMTASGRALSTNKPSGYVKIIVDSKEKILGVQILGSRASDMIAEATLALEMNAYLDDIANTIHAHPTFPEALSDAAEAAKNESIHSY